MLNSLLLQIATVARRATIMLMLCYPLPTNDQLTVTLNIAKHHDALDKLTVLTNSHCAPHDDFKRLGLQVVCPTAKMEITKRFFW